MSSNGEEAMEVDGGGGGGGGVEYHPNVLEGIVYYCPRDDGEGFDPEDFSTEEITDIVNQKALIGRDVRVEHRSKCVIGRILDTKVEDNSLHVFFKLRKDDAWGDIFSDWVKTGFISALSMKHYIHGMTDGSVELDPREVSVVRIPGRENCRIIKASATGKRRREITFGPFIQFPKNQAAKRKLKKRVEGDLEDISEESSEGESDKEEEEETMSKNAKGKTAKGKAAKGKAAKEEEEEDVEEVEEEGEDDDEKSVMAKLKMLTKTSNELPDPVRGVLSAMKMSQKALQREVAAQLRAREQQEAERARRAEIDALLAERAEQKAKDANGEGKKRHKKHKGSKKKRARKQAESDAESGVESDDSASDVQESSASDGDESEVEAAKEKPQRAKEKAGLSKKKKKKELTEERLADLEKTQPKLAKKLRRSLEKKKKKETAPEAQEEPASESEVEEAAQKSTDAVGSKRKSKHGKRDKKKKARREKDPEAEDADASSEGETGDEASADEEDAPSGDGKKKKEKTEDKDVEMDAPPPELGVETGRELIEFMENAPEDKREEYAKFISDSVAMRKAAAEQENKKWASVLESTHSKLADKRKSASKSDIPALEMAIRAVEEAKRDPKKFSSDQSFRAYVDGIVTGINSSSGKPSKGNGDNQKPASRRVSSRYEEILSDYKKNYGPGRNIASTVAVEASHDKFKKGGRRVARRGGDSGDEGDQELSRAEATVSARRDTAGMMFGDFMKNIGANGQVENFAEHARAVGDMGAMAAIRMNGLMPSDRVYDETLAHGLVSREIFSSWDRERAGGIGSRDAQLAAILHRNR